MCGKPNPAELDQCRFCGARLKPVTPSTTPLDPIKPGEMPTKKGTSDLEQTLPAWLREARQGADFSEATRPAPSVSISKSEPTASDGDFFAGLQNLSSEPQKAGDDFLSGLNRVSVEPPKPAEDFLAGLGKTSAEKEDEVPDWLAGIRGKVEQEGKSPLAQPPKVEPESSDWLTNLMGESETPQQSAAPESSGFGFGPVSEAPAQPAQDDSLDWLSGLSADRSFTEPAPSQSAEEKTDLSAWLSSLDSATPAAPAQPESASSDTSNWQNVPATPAASGDLPDWLSGGFGTPPAEPQSITPAAPSGEMPDWLSSLQAVPETPAPAAKEDRSFEAGSLDALDGGSMPDWLSNLGQAQETPAAAPEAPKPKPFGTGSLPSIEIGETPDWLSALGTTAAAGAAASDTPLWMQAESAKPAETADASASLTADSNAPMFNAAAGSESADSILSMDMPDWLSGFTSAETEKTAASVAADKADMISPVELPSWVQAMRPVEAVISESSVGGDEETGIEQQGPLAGLRNVLPSNLALMPARKPQAFSIKLNVSSAQQNQSSILEGLLNSESKPRALKPAGEALTLRTLRWTVAGILLLAILFPALMGTQLVPAPSLISPDTRAFLDVMSALPDGAPVLTVFDYEPGFSGELEAASSPVMDYLMLRGARLAFVSTNATGSFMADRMALNMLGTHTYLSGEQYSNFGYLPGGAAGVQAFASDPRGTIKADILGNDAWSLFPDVQALGDFAVVIILTENADTGRMWIEQAGSLLQGKPLLMVISAQAEPMIRPYYDSGQVQGLVTGLAGGAIYEEALQRPGRARQYWDAYGLAMIAAIVMITLGSAWNLITGWSSRRAEQAEE
jgi:hypothetical protein